jgi:hypothetical protein
MGKLDDLAEAVRREDLGEVDGHPVVRTSVSVRNAGDGLSRDLAVAPRVLHDGEEVVVVLRCRVDGLGFSRIPPVRDEENYQPRYVRNHVLKAKGATVLTPKDATQVGAFLRDSEQRQAEARAALEGQEQLDV